MRIITSAAIAGGTAILLALAATSPSFAKAHDNGLTNTSPFAGRTSAFDPSDFARSVDNIINKEGPLQAPSAGGNVNYGGKVSSDARMGETKSRSDSAPPSENTRGGSRD